MTYEEFIEKYGETEMRFSSYYKYVFTYKGTTDDGFEIFADYGGTSGDIYRHEVNVNESTYLVNLFPESIRVYKGRELVFKYDDIDLFS